MANSYKDEYGNEIVAYDSEESKELYRQKNLRKTKTTNGEEFFFDDSSEQNYDFKINNNQNNKRTVKKNKGCFGCLTSLIPWILGISLIYCGGKEFGRKHVNEYCEIDEYFENHQENEMQEELEKKKYYIYEKQECDIMLKEDYYEIKDTLSDKSTIETIKVDGVEKIKVTSDVRILSTKRKIKGFERIGEYIFSKDDQIFVFAKTYNQEGKAQDVKIANLEDFDTYIDEGYNFIGIVDYNAYDNTLFKTQYSSILDIEGYNYSDLDFEEKDITFSKKQ